MFVINNTYYNIFRDRESNGNEKGFNMELEVKT